MTGSFLRSQSMLGDQHAIHKATRHKDEEANEDAVPWPPFVCEYKIKKGFRVLGYDKSLASFNAITLHSCARHCSETPECASYDYRPMSATPSPNNTGGFGGGCEPVNCVLRPITAARVRDIAFGPSRELGWSHYERKARPDLFEAPGGLASDTFNTCGKSVR